MACRKGSWIVRYGEHVEVYDTDGQLLASFKVLKDMCKESFDIYLAVRHDVVVPYKIRKLKRG